MTDKRPFFFMRYSRGWGFIPKEDPYQSNILPIESWTADGKTYTFCRVCYKQHDAIALMRNAGALMHGPNLYCVLDDKNETIVTIWKPNITNTLEISLGKDDYKMVTGDISYDKLIKETQTSMKLSNVSVKKLTVGNYSHIAPL